MDENNPQPNTEPTPTTPPQPVAPSSGQPVVSTPPTTPPPAPTPQDPALIQPTPPEAPQKPEMIASSTPPKPVVEEEQKQSHGILSFVITIVAALLITQVINLFFFQSYRVFGSSMDPTLKDGDRLIISKIGKTTSKITGNLYEPERGDIIVFESPKEPDLQLIKRVIGLPGERVVVKDGKITVYNAENPTGFNPDKDSEWEKNLPEISGENDITVPDNELFVSGDNRFGSNSLDSRNELGTVPESLIKGRASLRLWPLQTASFL